jgi:hypothetical protein
MTNITIDQDKKLIERRYSVIYDWDFVLSYDTFAKDETLVEQFQWAYEIWENTHYLCDELMILIDAHLSRISWKTWNVALRLFSESKLQTFSYQEPIQNYLLTNKTYEKYFDEYDASWQVDLHLLNEFLDTREQIINWDYIIPDMYLENPELFELEAYKASIKSIEEWVTLSDATTRVYGSEYLLFLLLLNQKELFIVTNQEGSIVVCDQDTLHNYIWIKQEIWIRSRLSYVIRVSDFLIDYFWSSAWLIASNRKFILKNSDNKTQAIKDIQSIVDTIWKWDLLVRMKNNAIEYMKHEYKIPPSVSYSERLELVWWYGYEWAIMENWLIKWYSIQKNHRYRTWNEEEGE